MAMLPVASQRLQNGLHSPVQTVSPSVEYKPLLLPLTVAPAAADVLPLTLYSVDSLRVIPHGDAASSTLL